MHASQKTSFLQAQEPSEWVRFLVAYKTTHLYIHTNNKNKGSLHVYVSLYSLEAHAARMEFGKI